MLLSIFILAPASVFPIREGSAIVGDEKRDDGQVLVYYEGNLYNAQNLETYEQRLEIAAGRLVERYPTIARAQLPKEQLIRVGTYDTQAHVIDVEDVDALSAWAGEKVESGVTQQARDRELQRRYKDMMRRGIPFNVTDLSRF